MIVTLDWKRRTVSASVEAARRWSPRRLLISTVPSSTLIRSTIDAGERPVNRVRASRLHASRTGRGDSIAVVVLAVDLRLEQFAQARFDRAVAQRMGTRAPV